MMSGYSLHFFDLQSFPMACLSTFYDRNSPEVVWDMFWALCTTHCFGNPQLQWIFFSEEGHLIEFDLMSFVIHHREFSFEEPKISSSQRDTFHSIPPSPTIFRSDELIYSPQAVHDYCASFNCFLRINYVHDRPRVVKLNHLPASFALQIDSQRFLGPRF
jgi:hypothetical protein